MTEQEFEMYVHKYSDLVYRIAFSYLKGKEDAEDVYQNVFLKLYRSKKGLNEDAYVKRWLIRVTINECHSLWRMPWRQKRFDVADIRMAVENMQSVEMTPQEVGGGYEETVKDMLAGIPSKYGTVLYLYYYEEYSTKEIAGILKRKESTVRSQLMRGKELLKKKMTENHSVKCNMKTQQDSHQSAKGSSWNEVERYPLPISAGDTEPELE